MSMDWPLEFQDDILKTLQRLAAGGRFPHALIFEGPAGSGKRTAARYAASMLLCRGEGPVPCGECRSCKKALENHPDFAVLQPQNKSRTISVEQVRAMRLAAYVAPHEAESKVYFIPEAQRLRTEAQNALLKLIEEPPEAARFIFTVPSRENLLETVISRSAVLPMRQLERPERLSALKRLAPGQPEQSLAGLAGSCQTVGEALAALSDPEAMKLSDDAARLLELIFAGERYGVLTLLCGYEKDRELYIRLFSALQMAVIARLCGQNGQISALRANKIIAIIDRTVFSAAQNAGLPLLSCAAANRLIAAAMSALK